MNPKSQGKIFVKAIGLFKISLTPEVKPTKLMLKFVRLFFNESVYRKVFKKEYKRL